MKIFQNNKKYKVKVKSKKGYTVYTAIIIDEDDMHVKFKDRDGKQVTIKKEMIEEVSDV